MKIKKAVLITVIIILIALALPYIVDIADISLFKSTEEISVTIPQGTSVKQIGYILKENELIKSPSVFALKVRLSKYKNNLHFGKFKLSKKMTVSEIIKELGENTHANDTIKITFPEGTSVEQMAIALEKNNITSAKEFFDSFNDSYDFEFLSNIPKNKSKYFLQGFLFPSTYDFYENTPAHEVTEKMLAEFEKQYNFLENIKEKDIFTVITKASVIEKEAKIDGERTLIAGVIENRLNIDMPLQIDACVIYAISDGMYDVPVLYEKKLKYDSPYNTYKYKGLPIGPICCPGVSSINAALNPAQHEFLYYHTDEEKKDGSHIFTTTFNEHKNTMN